MISGCTIWRDVHDRGSLGSAAVWCEGGVVRYLDWDDGVWAEWLCVVVEEGIKADVTGDETDDTDAMGGAGVAAENVGCMMVGNGNVEMRVQWLGSSSLRNSSSSTSLLFCSCMHFASLKSVWLVLGEGGTEMKAPNFVSGEQGKSKWGSGGGVFVRDAQGVGGENSVVNR
ncbi:hypothetical protein ARMGADRAFT_1039232 [Armillaria gallica]|uniref:Uncharacterized protein n=1 Tax=Armillaria gallica TaxID=47427 RepID=A0A2H3CER1_ARMGA|nr:hypothetical protein ARMGADRAFT_1039232 [Armillaria gallica]